MTLRSHPRLLQLDAILAELDRHGPLRPTEEEEALVEGAAQLLNDLDDGERSAWRQHGRLDGR